MFGARFFDPSFTFVERGVSFLVLGLIVLGINAIYLWRKGKQRKVVNQRVRQARHQPKSADSAEATPTSGPTEAIAKEEEQ